MENDNDNVSQYNNAKIEKQCCSNAMNIAEILGHNNE